MLPGAPAAGGLSLRRHSAGKGCCVFIAGTDFLNSQVTVGCYVAVPELVCLGLNPDPNTASLCDVC